MRVLVYGLQSSGASLLAYFLAQKPGALALTDVYSGEVAPALDDARAEDIVVKCVITATHPLERHCASFKPDKTVLVVRHPYHNLASLRSKPYRDDDGSPERKLSILEGVFQQRKRLFDATVLYEDFLFRPEKVAARLRGASIAASEDFLAFKRSRRDLQEFNAAHSAWCREHYQKSFDFGNITEERLETADAFKRAGLGLRRTANRLCPSLCAHYRRSLDWDARMALTYLRCLLRPS